MSTTVPGNIGGAVAGPRKKIAVLVAVVSVMVGSFFVFSGKIPFIESFLSPTPAPPPYEIQVNGTPRPLDKQTYQAPPPVPVVEKSPPPSAAPPEVDDWAAERRTALTSKMGFFAPDNAAGRTTGSRNAGSGEGGEGGGTSTDAFTQSIRPTTVESSQVTELSNPRWLIEQGRPPITCIQTTRIKSTLPGMVTAVLDENVRGETGDVILLPKGSRAVGVIRNALMNGADLLSVMWMNITTPVLYDNRGMPHQFRIGVDSPFSSALGETGADGDIDRHLARKILGIVGWSLVQGGTQYLANSGAQQGTTQINLNSFQSGTNSAAEELLRAWITIPDVMTRNQGERCGIYIARDLRMDGVYKLFLLNKYGS